jgi:hypothetical protein
VLFVVTLLPKGDLRISDSIGFCGWLETKDLTRWESLKREYQTNETERNKRKNLKSFRIPSLTSFKCPLTKSDAVRRIYE